MDYSAADVQDHTTTGHTPKHCNDAKACTANTKSPVNKACFIPEDKTIAEYSIQSNISYSIVSTRGQEEAVYDEIQRGKENEESNVYY